MHVYRVTATVDVDLRATDPDGDCVTGQRPAACSTGRRAATVTGDRLGACAEFSTLELLKPVVNDDGGRRRRRLHADRRGTSPTSGHHRRPSVVPAGDYVLSETGPAGYTAGTGHARAARRRRRPSRCRSAADVVCTVVNDDNPVDLELTKSDDGITAVAGGAPFPYTITVDNVGTRDADLGEPVTVVDELPAGCSGSNRHRPAARSTARR